MMGFQGTPARLFYDFCLDEHVPSDHMLRGIDRHVDLGSGLIDQSQKATAAAIQIADK